MGGAIGLTSEAGQGSTFWFTLSVAASQCAYENDHFDALRGMRFALVERHSGSAMAIKQLLESWQCLLDEYDSVDQFLARNSDKSGFAHVAKGCRVQLVMRICHTKAVRPDKSYPVV